MNQIKFGKIQIPQDSHFDLKRAMELANLILVAYDEYVIWDRDKRLAPDTPIQGSTAFVEIDLKELEPNGTYGRLNRVWKRDESQKRSYKRLANFWFTEWWWASLADFRALSKTLNVSNIIEALRELDFKDFINAFKGLNFKNFVENLKNLVVGDQLLGFIAQSEENENKIFIVFRGTREPAEWLNNLRPKPQAFLAREDLGEVRRGFNRMYTQQQGTKETIAATLTRFFDDHPDLLSNAQIYVTGHSLGAALATLATLHIAEMAQQRNITPLLSLYTFACPRVGNEKFAEHFDALRCYSIINTEDLIQSVPLPTTQIVDDESFDGMSADSKSRIVAFRGFLEWITDGQAAKHYQHVGIPVCFTTQTGTIAGNHNLTRTYRNALTPAPQRSDKQEFTSL